MGILLTESSLTLSFFLPLTKTQVLRSPPFPQIPVSPALLLWLLLSKMILPSVAMNDILEVL